MKKVLFGVDHFCSFAAANKNVRIGLVTNDAAMTAFGERTRVALLKAGFNILRLFSPEHGLSAARADGAWVPNGTDSVTGLPISSLYGDKIRPTAEDLQEIDAVVFDIPDVGCRFYTYLWTMTHVMEACAGYDKKFIVLDRPNPISGDLSAVEGPMLDAACASFLGRWNIPIRHSCTLGELATYFAVSHVPNLALEIIKIQHWNRNDFPTKGNWDFIPTSPAIKDAETALLYPGLALLEGINVNEGRGTDTDFKVVGAPWIDATSLKRQLDKLNLPGIAFITTHYTPAWGLYQRERCYGVALCVTNEQLIRPVSLGIEIVKHLIQHYPNYCNERLYPTNANPAGNGHMDKLLGVQKSYELLKNNVSIPTQLHIKQWQEVIKPHLLY